MTTKTIGFIGCGRVTRIILEGLNREQKLPAHIVVSDPNPATLAKLKERFPQISTAPGDNPKAAGQDIVFLAVHPPAMGEAAGQIKGALRSDAIVERDGGERFRDVPQPPACAVPEDQALAVTSMTFGGLFG